MAGLSSKALAFGGSENKKLFNGYEQQNKEFSDGSGIEWYDYKHRFYDNQIGRFFVQDRLATDYVYYTPYQFAGNEVPNAIDLDGLEPLRMSTNGVLPPSDRLTYPKRANEWVPSTRSISNTSKNSGGIYMMGKSGEGEYGRGRVGHFKEGEGDPLNVALLVAAAGVTKSALDYKSAGNTLDMFKEQSLMWADARDGSDAKIAADKRNQSPGGVIKTSEAKDSNTENVTTDQPIIKKGDVFYTTSLGFNRVKLSDSTARLAAPSDGPAKDTVKPGQRF